MLLIANYFVQGPHKFTLTPFILTLIQTCRRFMLQNVVKGVDVYDDTLHCPWIFHLFNPLLVVGTISDRCQRRSFLPFCTTCLLLCCTLCDK